MLPIADQTAGPVGLTFFEDTQVLKRLKKFANFFVFFLILSFGNENKKEVEFSG